MNTPCLYIVATPIGNLGDISARALETLNKVDLIIAEDTRRSGQLLKHFGITTSMKSLHEHNEAEQAGALIVQLKAGKSMALISDAGTPLISDPGYQLVHQAQESNIAVVAVPGACAVIAALSVAGLPTDRFIFEGFLPAKTTQRCKHLEVLLNETRTIVLYEAPHRVLDLMQDCEKVLGAERELVLVKEITKLHETVHCGTVAEQLVWLQADDNHRRGEFVVLIHGATETVDDADAERVLKILLEELPVKQAAALAASITGASKNELYKKAIARHPGESRGPDL